jgi:hypothetical protein
MKSFARMHGTRDYHAKQNKSDIGKTSISCFLSYVRPKNVEMEKGDGQEGPRKVGRMDMIKAQDMHACMHIEENTGKPINLYNMR